jgi:hypothetical protein
LFGNRKKFKKFNIFIPLLRENRIFFFEFFCVWSELFHFLALPNFHSSLHRPLISPNVLFQFNDDSFMSSLSLWVLSFYVWSELFNFLALPNFHSSLHRPLICPNALVQFTDDSFMSSLSLWVLSFYVWCEIFHFLTLPNFHSSLYRPLICPNVLFNQIMLH